MKVYFCDWGLSPSRGRGLRRVKGGRGRIFGPRGCGTWRGPSRASGNRSRNCRSPRRWTGSRTYTSRSCGTRRHRCASRTDGWTSGSGTPSSARRYSGTHTYDSHTGTSPWKSPLGRAGVRDPGGPRNRRRGEVFVSGGVCVDVYEYVRVHVCVSVYVSASTCVCVRVRV